MPTSVGPNTYGEENLVFGYDLGDVSNSYKGEPTTNYGPADFANWGTEGDANDTAQRIATGNYYKGQPTYNCRAHSTQSYRGIDKTISGLRTAAGSSGTVTMSCMVRNNNPSAYNMYAYIGHDFGSTRAIAANSDWQKVQWTVNQSSMNNDYVEFRPYTANTSIYLEMTMPMVEVNKGHATQFTSATRSATQGLIDLTGNSTVDLTNVSFDSNAQVDYDGSNDYVSLGNPVILRDLTAGTIEAVYKRDASTGTYQMIFTDAGSDLEITYSGNVLQFYIGNSGLSYTHAVTGQYFYIAGTWGPGFKKMYINGVEVASGTNTGIDTGNRDRYIGGRGTSFPFNGKIPMVKVYSRTLTASEIKANYNAIKGRFNI